MSQKSHRKVYIIGGVVSVIMFFFSFAIVPFYSMICKATGLNTSVPNGELLTAYAESAKRPADMTREVTIQFVAMNHMGMPWDFRPDVNFKPDAAGKVLKPQAGEQKPVFIQSVKIHPGEKKQVYFYVKNMTDKNMTVQAIPSMTPVDAISFFHKIECFCFTQQSLKAREGKEMPLIFQVERELPKDIHVITLQYTLFDVTPKVTKKG